MEMNLPCSSKEFCLSGKDDAVANEGIIETG
jgi:hypothetical protein